MIRAVLDANTITSGAIYSSDLNISQRQVLCSPTGVLDK